MVKIIVGALLLPFALIGVVVGEVFAAFRIGLVSGIDYVERNE